MLFFDYLYYLIYRFYSPKEKGAASSSAGVIGGLQAANTLTVYLLFLLFSRQVHLNKVFFIVVIVIFQITTYIRYIYKDNNSIVKIESYWQKMNEQQKTRMRIWGILYITLSVIILFGLAILLGSGGLKFAHPSNE